MVVAVIWAWRCGSGARYGAHASADRRTDASTTSAARDRADYRPSAGADQTAAHRAIGGIVRVRDGCGRQHKSSADHAGYGRLLCHSLSTEKLREWGRLLDQLAIEVQLNSPMQRDKQMARGCSSSPGRARAFAPPATADGAARGGANRRRIPYVEVQCKRSTAGFGDQRGGLCDLPRVRAKTPTAAPSPARDRERLRGRFPAQRRSQWRLPDLSCGPRLPPWQRRWSGSPSPRP